MPESEDHLEQYVDLANEVRTAPNRRHLPPTGNCRDVCLAVCMRCPEVGGHISLCIGRVGGEANFWLEHAGFIIDPTADQFGAAKEVLVKRRCELPTYKEETYIIFNSGLLRPLLP